MKRLAYFELKENNDMCLLKELLYDISTFSVPKLSILNSYSEILKTRSTYAEFCGVLEILTESFSKNIHHFSFFTVAVIRLSTCSSFKLYADKNLFEKKSGQFCREINFL
jgi:hypothetical protein